jgi:phosphoribosyl 1,2-cyclic phosphate phosphodiesterase
MKLLFLGTSSGWPLPRLGCKCRICSSEDERDKRLRPSVLVNERVLIDASPDIYHQLNKHGVEPTAITDILITHAHDDHIMGLYDLSHIYNRQEKIRLRSSSGVLSSIRKKIGISMNAFKVEEVELFRKILLENNISSWFIPVIHGNIEAYGIKIKAPKPFLYAPEFRRILPSSKKVLGDLDLAIIDGSSKTKHGQAKGHETIVEGIRLGKELKPKRILFTNIGHKTDCYLALEQYVKTEGGQKFGIAFDGLEVKL